MLACRWRRADLDLAITLAEALLERFEDRERGGFYFTADDHERLVHRSKSFMDESLPAGNGVAAAALSRLGHLLGESRYVNSAERALRAAWEGLGRFPHAHGAMVNALEEHLHPPQTIVLRGGTGPELERWRERALRHYAPARQVLAIPGDAGELPGLLGERRARGGPVTAYVCEGHRCEAPTEDLAELDALLAASEVPRHRAYPEPAVSD
jgi:uncharacterized protein YyaL (SSP411 family)